MFSEDNTNVQKVFSFIFRHLHLSQSHLCRDFHHLLGKAFYILLALVGLSVLFVSNVTQNVDWTMGASEYTVMNDIINSFTFQCSWVTIFSMVLQTLCNKKTTCKLSHYAFAHANETGTITVTYLMLCSHCFMASLVFDTSHFMLHQVHLHCLIYTVTVNPRGCILKSSCIMKVVSDILDLYSSFLSP